LSTPTPLPPCADGEACKEVVDASCVVFTGDPLDPVNVETNDRLTSILQKWAETVASNTQAISTQQTLTTTFQGNGTGASPLMTNVRVSTYPPNLLQVVDYVDEFSVHRTGLQVVLTTEALSSMLTKIAESESLRTQFCSIIASCTADVCSIATDLFVSVPPGSL
jgi:hypothetical protein